MKLYVLLALTSLVFLVSCASGSPATTSPTMTAVSVQAESTLPSALPSVSEAGGAARFRDDLGTADQFVLNLSGVPAPPDGQTYQGWLLGGGGEVANTGVFIPQPDGSVNLEWNSPKGENLLNRYSRFQITLEPAAGSANPTGQVVFAGGFEDDLLAKVRRLFVKNEEEPATPLNVAFIQGLTSQTDLAVQHVQNAVNAAAIGALPEMHAHMEHTINILEGAAGPAFGDHDGNGTAANPGDGFGVASYSTQIARLFSNQATVVAADADVQAQIMAVEGKCIEIINIEDPAEAAAQLEQLKTLAGQLKSSQVAGLYQAVQGTIGFEVTAVQ